MRPSLVNVAILRCAGMLVPGGERDEWFAEWSAELWYVERGATRFCLGAFQDAWWVRRNRERARRVWLDSPVRCMVFLAVLAAVSGWLNYALPKAREVLPRENFAGAVPVLLGMSLLLCGSAAFRLGEYPANHNGWRRWSFLAIKVVLVLTIACCGSLDVASFIAKSIQPHGLMVGLIAGLRWAMEDQRRRCPVCLRLVTSPTRIGGPSRTFLEWYGTELICNQGHGLLYVPEMPNSCYSTQRWQSLDTSWKSLFS